jgi:hypothetical protein
VIAGVYNLNIDQGATFERLITVKDSSGDLMDLTSYTARMHIRPEMEEDDEDEVVVLTTENGHITLGGAAGTIALELPPTITASLRRDCVYDLELVHTVSGKVYRLLKGIVRISDEVTR